MQKISLQIQNLPQKCGVYIFKDQENKILYIGKAAKIKTRVSSYFQKSKFLSEEKKILVQKVKRIDYIITDSEIEALLLESNLIKQYKPIFNISLKDDKQYKYIKIDYADDFPKIYTVRKITPGPASYYGPFTDAFAVKQTLTLLSKLFPFRNCNQNILVNTNKKSNQKVCLRYHIKRCPGPCAGKISKDAYNLLIRKCQLFLQGKQNKIISNLKSQMEKAACKRQFEKAALLRNQINDLKKIIAEQKIISQKPLDQDIISYFGKAHDLIINLFVVREGKLIGKENFRLKSPKNASPEEILSAFVKQYYNSCYHIPKEIILQNYLHDQNLICAWLDQKSKRKVKFTIPKSGKKKKLIELGIKNAKTYLTNSEISKETSGPKALKSLTSLLKLKKSPLRIECFDISNIQGHLATGGMVVFEKGLPKKQEYRRFKIKVKKINDIEMLYEMLYRRFKNSSVCLQSPHQNRWPLPDLIIVDGGRAQLNVAYKVLRRFNLDIPVLALAKKNEEIYLKEKKKPLTLSNGSKALLLLRQIRDEAHRFAIAYHKVLRQKEIRTSQLDKIPGIGQVRKIKLLAKFGSPEAVKNASFLELKNVVGEKLAKNILQSTKAKVYKAIE